MPAESDLRRLINPHEQKSPLKSSLTMVVGAMRSGGVSYRDAIRQFEAAYVSNVITINHGHLGKVAEQLGMHRNTLTRTLRELDLKKRI